MGLVTKEGSGERRARPMRGGNGEERDTTHRHGRMGGGKISVSADTPKGYEIWPEGVRVHQPTNVAVRWHTASMYREENHPFLSLRCVFGGTRTFEVGGSRVAVNDHSY